MSCPSAINRERILEAIDQLRHRKARPDIQRICGYLFRRYHTNSTEAKADLDWCVAHNIVLKVEYKGSISYRNAAKKYAQMKQRGESHIYTAAAAAAAAAAAGGNQHIPQPISNNNINKSSSVSKNFMELLTNVFGELIVDEPDYLELGVPPKEIVDNILSKDSVRYTRNYVAILLVKEVERGNLIKLGNGNYLLGPCAEDKKNEWRRGGTQNGQNVQQVDAADEVAAPKKRTLSKAGSENGGGGCGGGEKADNVDLSADERKSSDGGTVRSGGRRKKAKKVFDPSDTHIPRKRGRPAGSLNKSTIEKQMARNSDDSRPDSRTSTSSKDQHGVCSVCHVQSKRGPNDRMVACRECSNKAHFSCLNGEDMMLKMYPDNTWQCPHCKTCVVCYETSDAGNLTVCSVCADGYHASCHQPRITEKVRNGERWLCINCQRPDELKINEIQSNIGDSFNSKIVNELRSDNSNNSISSEYNSPVPSPTPPHLSPQTNQPDSPDRDARSDSASNNSDSEDPNIDPSIPDATHWTPNDVYQYFAKYFPEEAKIFKEQEIDGRSLLLLKRMDVLTNLNLKLGPALKIYRHVTMLQVRRDDRSLYWL